jgi:hypothetical protein
VARRQFWLRCAAIGAALIAIGVAIILARPSSSTARTAKPSVSVPSRVVEPQLPIAPKPVVIARVMRDGKPVPDVLVSITDGSRPVVAHAFSDRDGQVKFDELPRGPYELWASASGLASPPVRIDDATTIELALAPAADVHGELVAEGLVTGATITLVPLDGDHATRIAAVDEAGRFAIDGVPLGRWRVEADAPGHVQTVEQVIRVGGEHEDLAVHVVRAGSVSGVVVDSHGEPVPNATIVLRDQAGVQRPLVIASTGLRWVHPLAVTRQMPANDSGRFSAPRAGARPTECGRGHCGIDIGSVRGTVVHAAADGEIASIFAESRTEAGKVVVIHHGGGLKSFYMHLDEIRPGLEVGQVIHAGEPVGLLGSTGFTRAIPHVHFAITYESGRTWYLDPEPILRHAVVLAQPRAYEPFEPSTTREPLAGKPVIRRITSDAHGAFHIDGVAPGSYVAGAFASDFAPGASPSFAVTGAQDTADVRVTLDAGIAVKGVVVGPAGAIPDAVVMAGAGIGETAHKIATTRTDKNGRFVLRALAGKVTIAVQVPMYGEQERAIFVDERTREQTFQLVIENAQLRGQVLAPDGGAAPGVTVRVVEGPTHRRTVTDAQGRFALDRVAAGNYTVEMSSPDFPSKRLDLVTEQWREVRLEAGGALRVRVRDAQSAAPLAGVRIEVGSATCTTDLDGVAEVRGLLAGEHVVAASKPGYTPAKQSAAVRAERVPKEVQLSLARGATIAGTVRDRYGRRVAGARVTIGAAATKTDAEGNFRIADAPAGTGVVEAELDGARGTLPVELAPGAERSALAIELQ